MKNIKQQFIQTVKISILSLALVGGVTYLSAWTGPTATPPNGNVDAPLHVGTNLQTKAGAIWSSFFGTTGGGYFGGKLGIKTQAPTADLQVNGTVRLVKEGPVSPTIPTFGTESYSTDVGGSAGLSMLRARGTAAVPAAVVAGDRLGGLYGTGYGGGTFWGTNGHSAGIQFYADENFTATRRGSTIKFETTLSGTQARSTRMIIHDDGTVEVFGDLLVRGKACKGDVTEAGVKRTFGCVIE